MRTFRTFLLRDTFRQPQTRSRHHRNLTIYQEVRYVEHSNGIEGAQPRNAFTLHL